MIQRMLIPALLIQVACMLSLSCTGQSSIHITVSTEHVSYDGTLLGSAVATVTGGVPPYNYRWNTSPGQNTQTAINLNPGTYRVTVTDADGKEAIAFGTVSQRQELWACGDNFHGTIGNGSSGERINALVRVGIENDWIIVSSGQVHTLAIKMDGTLWAWGKNESGQLGDGTTTNRYEPKQIGTDTDWAMASAADAASIALKKDGSLWSWGTNVSFNLGDGTVSARSIPQRVGTDSDWALISNDIHSLALKQDGSLWCWGFVYGIQNGVQIPTRIGTDKDWINVISAANLSVALKRDGSAWSWGRNQSGQTGTGTTADPIGLPPKRIGIDFDWFTIESRGFHAVGLKRDGSLWTWGANGDGQLGYGTNVTLATVPNAVGSEKTWAKIASGSFHSVALKKDGSLWAWGDNRNGQLGLGDFASRNIPEQVGTDLDWQNVATGRNVTFVFRKVIAPVITGFASLDVLTSCGNTPFNELEDVPQRVEFVTSKGSSRSLPVLWDATSYKPDIPGVYNLIENIDQSALTTDDVQWLAGIQDPNNILTSVVLQINVLPQLTLGADINTCSLSTKLSSNISNADTYSWQTPSGILEDQPELIVTVSGEYSLIITQNGCEQTDVIQVAVNNITEGNFKIIHADINLAVNGIMLTDVPLGFLNTTGTGTDFRWTFGDGTSSSEESPAHTYTEPGIYTISLEGVDSRNCQIIAAKVIEIKNILITSAISPNGDNKNDKLFIEPLLFEASFKVVDRNGKTVFEASPYHDDFTGKNLESDVYYYELYFMEIDRHYKGAIHIIK